MGDELVREGDIKEGDVVREIAGVDLRRPIDGAVWKLTVGLIKMAPRPLVFMVAEELPPEAVPSVSTIESGAGRTNDKSTIHVPANDIAATTTRISAETAAEPAIDSTPATPAASNNNAGDANDRFGPERIILFYDPSLGVKLHHDPDGHVRILAVTPYKTFPDAPRVRTGVVLPGDYVHEVGGVWNTRDPISDQSWATLVRFIREGKRPLAMVVAAAKEEAKVEAEEEGGGKEGEEKEVNEKENGSGGGLEKMKREDLCKDMSQHLSFDALNKELSAMSSA